MRTTFMRECVVATILGSSLAVASANAQIDVIRRARSAVRDATPSVASLFGKEPAITTTIDDAHDGVAALDGFEPQSYSTRRWPRSYLARLPEVSPPWE